MSTQCKNEVSQVELAKMYKAKQRPLCHCRNPGVEMYIAKIGENYIIKRMPDTGYRHSPNCDSYEPPPEVSGLGEVLGTAIKENMELGYTELKFGFSMSKGASRGPAPSNGNEKDSVKTDGNKLSLRSTLQYMWEQAGFHKWSPAMEGKRNWGVIRKHLLSAVEDKMAKGKPLSEHLYIPEVFSIDKKDAIAQRRVSQMSKMSGNNKARQLALLVGELKEIAPSRYGHKIVVKHAADFGFMLNDDINKKLLKRFASEIEMWDGFEDVRMIVIATFGVSSTGIASVEEVALMTVTNNWIPFETIYDKTIIESLTKAGRKFTKSLRYNLPTTRPLACVVLSDTQPQPVAMYVVPSDSTDDFIAASDKLMNDSRITSWVWNTSDFEMPYIPDAEEKK